MKIVCNTETLMDAVTTVGRAVSGKSTLPALEGILLRASGTSLFLAGFDLELGITTTMEAEVIEPGEMVLTAKLFSEIIRKMPGMQVSLITDEKNNVRIKSDVSEFTIIGISAAEYPDLPLIQDGIGFTLPQPIVKSMIGQTLFAIAQTDMRPAHTGSLFEIEPDILRIVSLDGSRLAMRMETVKNDQTGSFVVPGKTLHEVLKLLSDEDIPLWLSVGNRHLIWEIGKFSVISRLLDGEFLAYNKAIPDAVTTTVTVNTRALIETVERASLVINDRIKSPLVCQFHDGCIEVACTTVLGSAQDTVPAHIDGAEEKMGFNSRFLLEALRNAEVDEVRIELNGAISPMKILPPEGESFLFLVLPVRLKN